MGTTWGNDCVNLCCQLRNFYRNSKRQSIGKRAMVCANALLSMARTENVLNSQPVILQIEPTSRCNLDCIMCIRKTLKPFGDMTLQQYKELLDDMPYLHGIWLQGQGEPLLHDDLPRMILEAKNRGISTLVITNGTLLNENMAYLLDYAGLDELGISFNSTDKKTYESIMRNASFDKVVANIKHVASMPNRKMKVFFSVTLMKSNEKEIGKIIKFAEDVGIDEVVIRPLAKGGDYANGYVNNNFTDKFNARSCKVKVTYRNHQTCRWPWQSMYVAWNGNVMPCCHILNYNSLRLGNVFKEGVWKSENYHKFRKGMLNKTNAICEGCRLYGK